MAKCTDNPVVIVGAGLAGLACATFLARTNVTAIVLEASDSVGGRVRTDRVESDGGVYLIDRGFQVYLTAYPEGRRVLRTAELGFRSFVPGAMVRFEGRFWRMADPLRAPWALPGMLRSPLLTARDIPALASLDTRLRLSSQERFWAAREETSEEFLISAGISTRAIERFFRPFFGGVFLDRSLKTSARRFRATYRMFARGRAALPIGGMQAIPIQLASGLGPTAVRTRQVVTRISSASLNASEVILESGESIDASAVVVAADGSTAAKLVAGLQPPRWKSTVSISFAADMPPSREPILYLDGDGTGPVNHVAVISNVQPGYAPAGRTLISASVVAPHDLSPNNPTLERRVRVQLREWFGARVDGWSHIRTDFIEHALPDEDAPALASPKRPVVTRAAGVFVAGDHVDNASINGALESGRRAAEAVLSCR